MRRTLTVTTAAADLHLLTVAEMRAAAGVTDGSQDNDLQAMSLRISAAIAAECNIAVGAGAEPTLKQETLTETIRNVEASAIALSRRHYTSITSVTVNDQLYDADQYEVDAESGMLYRLCNDYPTRWCARKIVVVYQAGFSTIPGDLKMAAMDFFRLAWQERDRDPSVKSEEVDVVGVARTKTDFWVGALPGVGESSVPDVVSGQLQRFRNIII